MRQLLLLSLSDICWLLGFFFSSRRRHTRYIGDWSSDVCSSDLVSSHRGPGNRDVRRVRNARRSPADNASRPIRSEERRVGKECRSPGSPYEENKNKRRLWRGHVT